VTTTRPTPAAAADDGYRSAAGRGTPSLARSSGVMALGTIGSRVTGFARTAVLLYAIGTTGLGDAYNVANNLPNAIYDLALGGVLTSVVVPLLVTAAVRHADRGEAYCQRVFTLGVLALGVVTVAATAAAVPVTALYAHGMRDPATYHLTLIFTYFFLPQIFFYGVSSLVGAILNTRGRFAAPMWTPILNNVVVMAMALALILIAGTGRTPSSISPGEVVLLGLGTTVGIVAQAAAVWWSMRRAGFRWRPRFDFRRTELAGTGRMAGWMFVYVAATQLALLATTVVANAAGARVCAGCAGAGYAAFSNAWQLFQLPYAIIGVSVITALLPRMSAHASAGEHHLLRRDFSTAARLSSVIIVPAVMILAVLGPPLAQGIFGHGATSAASARYLGIVLAVFCLGLLPYTLFNLLLRACYAMQDAKTPALVGAVAMAVRIAASFAALLILPPSAVVAGLGVGFGLSSLIMAGWLWRVVARRIGGLDGRRIGRTLVRMHLAAVPGLMVALGTSVVTGHLVPGRLPAALVTVAVGGSTGLAAYLATARLLHVAEVSELAIMVRTRLGR
jgi:putative peptidoglycan lipid II flippase